MSEIKTKKYALVINGLQESIDQVDKLKKQLEELDARIQALSDKTIKINVDAPQASVAQTTTTTTSSTSSRSGNNSGLSEEEKLLKQINDLEQKRAAYQSELYQGYLANKELLKETLEDQKQLAASERMQAGQYTNTMQGMKQELSDIKQVMQTVDLGDTEKFKQLTDRANELNKKLLEVEKSYGQFGRNVENYPDATEGINNLVIAVGGVDREFRDAREASRALSNELKTMAINGQQDTDEFKELQKTVLTLNSAIKDATVSSSAMDNMLDTMQSLTAMASVGQGIGAFFGMDNDKIEQTIQKLVALQNILQGVEKIRQQMKSGEFLGGLFAKGNEAIDKFSASLLGVSNNAKAASTGLKTTSVAMTTVGTASKTATIAVKALSLALKAIGIGAVIAGVMALINAVEKWTEKQNKAAEAAEEAAEKTSKAITEQRNTFVGASATYMNTASRLSHLRTEYMATNNEMRKTSIIKEATEIFKKFGISVKSVSDAQNILINQGDKVIEMIKLQGDAAALAALRMEAFKKSFNMLLENGYDVKSASILAGYNSDVVELDKQLDKVSQNLSNLQKELGVNLKNSSDSIKKTVVDAEALIAKARVDAMKQGFVKTLAQLKLERDRRIAEAKRTGKLVQEQIAFINRQYQDKVFEARVQYHTNLINEEKKYADKIEKINEELYQKAVENSKKRNELRKADKIDKAVDLSNEFEVSTLTIDYNSSDVRKYISQYGKDVLQAYTNTRNTVEYLQNALSKVGDNYEKLPLDAQKIFDKYSKMLDEAKEQLKLIEDENKGISEVVKSIGVLSEKTSEAYALRTEFRKDYYNNLLKASQDAADKELEIENDKLDTEYDLLKKNEEKRHQLMISRYYDEGESEEETKRRNKVYDTPRAAFENYLVEYDEGNLFGKTQDQLGTYFSDKRKLMDEWLENLKKAVKEEEITWEEYNEFMSQEAIQGYLKAKTEYENFLLQYNSMSDVEKTENESDLKEVTRNLNNTYVEYLDEIRAEQDIHNNKMKVIKNQYQNEVKETEINHIKQRQSAYTEYYNNLLSETENVLSSVNNKIDKAEKVNAWGIINYSATKKELKDLQVTIEAALNNIASQKEQLLERLKKGEISFGDYDTLISQLKVVETQAQDTAQNVSTKLNDLTGEWWGSIDQWVQMVGQGISQVMSSLSEITQNQYEAQIAQQEEYISKYEELLKRQEDITKEHADKVNDIEDELKNARGDRRQQLIDQLNAEMAAQRASLAQQKKIEKEEEKAKREKKKLEHDQAVAKKRMDLAQAYINMAMAISMAAVNKWPVPAIPMMAMAAAAGAAQIAAIQSQNIPSYGDGGVIQGKSHAQGGVKVLGGRAEVEGGEFITNKLTTSNNVELLEFINTKKKRVNLDDMIEFYVGKHSNVKRVISSVSPKTKFADGGQIPMLRDDINISNRLLNTMEAYANRPVYVAVTEIEDAQANVNYVRALSGLEN